MTFDKKQFEKEALETDLEMIRLGRIAKPGETVEGRYEKTVYENGVKYVHTSKVTITNNSKKKI